MSSQLRSLQRRRPKTRPPVKPAPHPWQGAVEKHPELLDRAVQLQAAYREITRRAAALGPKLYLQWEEELSEGMQQGELKADPKRALEELERLLLRAQVALDRYAVPSTT